MDVVVQHAPEFTAADAESLARDRYGVTGSAESLPSERDQNFRVTAADGRRFVLKIANATESRETLDFQNAALEHLASRQPGLAVPRVVRSVPGETIGRVVGPGGREHFVRLLTWVPGKVLADVRPHAEALLEELGRVVARTNAALADFEHPAMSRALPWDALGVNWVAAELHRFGDPDRRALVSRVIDTFDAEVAPRLDRLRLQVVHNDWNDYNVIVDAAGDEGAARVGVIDLGDMIRSAVAADLAVACTYAMLGKPDPLAAAAAVVRGFHQVLPLTDDERAVLLPLIRARLALSVAMAARQSEAAPANEYLLISQQQTWPLIERLDRVHPGWALCVFRTACGLPACAWSESLSRWMSARRDEFAPVVGCRLDAVPVVVADLGVGSLDIPRPEVVQETARFSAHVDRLTREAGAELAVGRYDEARLAYVTDLFRHPNNWREEHRTVHLGVDLFRPAGSPVFAPLEGVVHSAADNAAPGDYGPTIVLEHAVDDGAFRFFTLYGHLSAESLADMTPGRRVARGEQLARLGDQAVNGGWPPHLHFQVIADMLGRAGDFPGVAAPSERSIWLSLCPDPGPLLGLADGRLRARELGAAELAAMRQRRLGRNLSVSYREPIVAARAYKQYLYDAGGRAYLDAVNNVPHVGHNHPRVVEAVSRQMAVLNTNTRYLHESILTYAERLCALMPPPLGVCYLVCSGSEANELALRLARARTGRRDVVVVDVAYHGNTTTLVDISPYKFAGPGGAGRAPFVHQVTMPDTYRGPFRAGDPLAGARYGAEVERVVERARSEGREVGAFICESLLGCGGQIVLPEGYLARAYAAIRAAGGVAIADEVQVGFGRVGTRVWGFETQGVVPDIVTLGKPIGNGFPMGAVVTTPEIAEAFDNGMEYFNTFGGSQAACAAGHAVLDVMRDEGLQAHALEVGARLTGGLAELGREFPVVGDVRGLGLFIGVEIVEDRASLRPAARQADYVVNRMKQRGVLLSTDGPLHNVLKIKPPLPFSAADADRLVERLRETLKEDGAQP